MTAKDGSRSTIPWRPELHRLTGDFAATLVLQQMCFWTSRYWDHWVEKSLVDIEDAFDGQLPRRTLRRKLELLESLDLVQTKRTGGSNRYRVNEDLDEIFAAVQASRGASSIVPPPNEAGGQSGQTGGQSGRKPTKAGGQSGRLGAANVAGGAANVANPSGQSGHPLMDKDARAESTYIPTDKNTSCGQVGKSAVDARAQDLRQIFSAVGKKSVHPDGSSDPGPYFQILEAVDQESAPFDWVLQHTAHLGQKLTKASPQKLGELIAHDIFQGKWKSDPAVQAALVQQRRSERRSKWSEVNAFVDQLVTQWPEAEERALNACMKGGADTAMQLLKELKTQLETGE